MTFDYGSIAEPVAIEVREAAQRIKLRLRRSAEDIIEIGKDLLAVKARIGHGNFLPWIEAEFGMGHSAAYRFINVAEVYGSKLPTVGSLPPTALYELAAPKTPPEVREEVERMIAAGEVVTKATIDELRLQAEDAGKKVTALESKNQELTTTLQEGKQEIPEAELDAIRSEGAAEVEARTAARIKELTEANVAANKELAALKKARDEKRDEQPPAQQPTGKVIDVDFGGSKVDDGDDEYFEMDEATAIGAFSGAVGSCGNLEFDPHQFWEYVGTGHHRTEVHKAMLSMNAKCAALLREFEK